MQLPLTKTCLLCQLPVSLTEILCDGCYEDLPHIHNGCQRCGIPIKATQPLLVCGQCQLTPPEYDHCHAGFTFEFPIDALITDMKTNHNTALARPLASLIARTLPNEYRLPELLIPVPMFKDKLKSRGFNQAQRIGHYLSKTLSLPTAALIQKAKSTAEQKHLKRQSRQLNVKDVFEVNPGLLEKAQYRCQHVAIIDDVITTGATVNQIASLLKASGIQKVDVWAVAKTDKNHK